MKVLGRKDILDASDLHRESVDVPEWGGAVLVRGLTGKERDALEESTVQRRGRDVVRNFENLRARLVSMALVDENGARLFSEEDVEALGGKSARALDRVYAVAQRLAGLSPEDVKELTEGLKPAQSGGSSSA
jgi:hypothetical protein